MVERDRCEPPGGWLPWLGGAGALTLAVVLIVGWVIFVRNPYFAHNLTGIVDAIVWPVTVLVLALLFRRSLARVSVQAVKRFFEGTWKATGLGAELTYAPVEDNVERTRKIIEEADKDVSAKELAERIERRTVTPLEQRLLLFMSPDVRGGRVFEILTEESSHRTMFRVGFEQLLAKGLVEPHGEEYRLTREGMDAAWHELELIRDRFDEVRGRP